MSLLSFKLNSKVEWIYIGQPQCPASLLHSPPDILNFNKRNDQTNFDIFALTYFFVFTNPWSYSFYSRISGVIFSNRPQFERLAVFPEKTSFCCRAFPFPLVHVCPLIALFYLLLWQCFLFFLLTAANFNFKIITFFIIDCIISLLLKIFCLKKQEAFNVSFVGRKNTNASENNNFQQLFFSY